MSVSEDLINFDLIETHKENIQQLPGGRSARQLVNILSPMPTGTSKAPSFDDTRTLNDAIRHEYELEVQNIADSDDPLDVFDRYVKWTLNAYPSAQATPQSQLLPLLERATKAFLSSSHYKNDPRYLKLWLHYIRWFSDAPRETFAYLSRHGIGEGLALFYEEFAAWLESAGRWTQAEEVYKLGIEREARPTERLMRKYGQFQQRLEARPQDVNGPTSPALPTVRPALAAKIDPFASTPRSNDSPAARTSQGSGTGASSRPGKPKMAVFSDADNASPPAIAPPTDGWQSIGSLQERKKENAIAAKPWAGETLKAGKRVGNVEKMTIFKDQTPRINELKISDPVSNLPPPVVNSKTGKAERVFVNLEAVYPNSADPSEEMSFDELRSIHRGWADRDWRKESIRSLQAISGNAQRLPPTLTNAAIDNLSRDLEKKASLDENESSQQSTPVHDSQNQSQEIKPAKQKRMKIREVKQETQTIKTNLASPTGPKIRRKLTAEPTMTFHSKAATHDVYDLFNQPLKCEAPKEDTQSGGESDFEDDGYSTAGESTGTGMISGVVSESGNDDTSVSVRTTMTADENTGTGSADDAGEWTEFSTSKHVPLQKKTDPEAEEVTSNQPIDSTAFSMVEAHEHQSEELKTPVEPEAQMVETKTTTRFVPIPPENYDPTVLRTYRDPSNVAQSRLPFMTPIVEKTESSLAANTVYQKDERDYFLSKTPSRSSSANDGSPSKIGVDRLLLSSPFVEDGSPQRSGGKVRSKKTDFPVSPSPKSKRPSRGILEEQDDLSSPRKKVQITQVKDSPTKIKVKVTTTPLSPFSVNHENGLIKPISPPPRANQKEDFIIPAPPSLRPAPSQRKTPTITDLQCNPTDPSIRKQILASLDPPLSSYPGFFEHTDQDCGQYAQLQKYVKKVSDTKVKSSPRKPNDKSVTQAVPPVLNFTGASRVYAVKRELGQGAFAPVYLVESYDPDRPLEDPESKHASDASTPSPTHSDLAPQRAPLEALKAEAPPSQATWEFHIIRTIRSRLDQSPQPLCPRTLSSIIHTHELHLFPQSSAYLLLSYHPHGTFLSLLNTVKASAALSAAKPLDGLDEPLALFFAVELLRALEALHTVGILHGDIKADNCLVRLPTSSSAIANLGPYCPHGGNGWKAVGLLLIDFGRGIDLHDFSARVGFIADWAAGAADAPELREARPWLHSIDTWGTAGVLHLALLGRYLETVVDCRRDGAVMAKKRYKLKDGFKRYWQAGIWAQVFEVLLNPRVPVSTAEADTEAYLEELRRVRRAMEDWLVAEAERRGLRGMVARAERLLAEAAKRR